MTSLLPPRPVAAPRPRSRRDPVIDAVRAGCLLVVVALHALLVGAWRDPDGSLATGMALAGHAWFIPITWLAQVMPLFFIAGGFAAISQWRRLRARGVTAVGFVELRIKRLAVPAGVMIAVVGTVLACARVAGLPADLAAEAAYRSAQPLWFLAVYLGATALVPVLAAAHERFGARVPAVGLGAVLAVDLVRQFSLAGPWSTGLAYLNLAFVWLFCQQLGFVLADTRGRNRSGPWAGLLAAVSGILVLLACGWSPDLIASLNPPTALFALGALAELCLLRLVRPRLERLVTGPALAGPIKRAGGLAMTVYLWHMPIALALVAALWAAGAPLPALHSPAWWLSRPLWLALVAGAVIPAAVWLSRLERWEPRLPLRPLTCRPALRVAASAVAAIGGVVIALLGGLGGLSTTVAAVCLLVLAVWLATSPTPAGRGTAVFAYGDPEAPVIWAIHGFRSSHHALEPLAQDLAARGFRVLAPDLPGCGESDPLPAGHGIEDLGAWLRGLLDREPAPALLLGHSLGSVIVAEAIAQGAVHRGAVLVNPIVTAPRDNPHRLAITGLRAYYGLAARLGPFGDVLLAGRALAGLSGIVMASGTGLRRRGGIVLEHMRDSHSFNSGAALLETFHTSLRHCVGDSGADFTRPVLVLGGEHDALAPVERQLELVDRIPCAVLRVLPGVGHLVPREAHVAAAAAVDDWAADL